ncbi:hypothetical protein PV405_08810 [Streptomyces sp. ME02-6979-3A]|uniref:hypothetical protein n=1 Tax=Streptomyces sp. ME02-6979-3A TaxID=3028673 RepID=UPI0029B081A1|nr:hypothetical protein [Streptomyces sp. ME02-6979-3A]MDX3324767.1 hypothetical protein [Streptomyces sp. ME02-6979-3A]
MSGGSYNYLYAHPQGDLEARRGSIEAMRDRLAGLEAEGVPGAARAARLTRYVLIHLDLAEAKAQELAEVWHAIEWWDSNDYGEDDVHKTLAEWQEKTGLTYG